MKIVHLVGWYFPDSVGGTEVYVEGLCRRLRAAGHDVLIAAPVVGDAAPAHYLHDGVEVFRYSIPAEPSRDEAYGRLPVRGAEALYTWLREQRPDLLHVHSFTTGVGLPEIREARRAGMRVVVTCHLPGLGFMCRTGELMQWGRVPCDGIVAAGKCGACNLTRLGMAQPIAQLVTALPTGASRALSAVPGRIGTTFGMRASVLDYEAAQRELFSLIDRFVVLNETARRMLIANGSPASKLIVNRLGVSQASVSAKPAPDVHPTQSPVRFGYVGRLHSSKGVHTLIDAVRRIPAAVPFVLEVRGPSRSAEAREFVDAMRLRAAGDPRVTFAAGVSAGTVPDVLRGLDVLLCPSIWFENGPTVALEAHAVGTPVIGSGVGNLAEIVDDGVNGRLVAPGDVTAWAEVLTDVAQHPDRTVDRWRQHIVPQRTMDDIARDYLALYAA